MSDFDVAIVGLGAMGSAAASELAHRGQRVVGFDRFGPPHAEGSSHGKSRIIREAYFEHPAYVPLLKRAFEAWPEVSKAWGRKALYHRTGGLNIGPEDGVLVGGALKSVREYQIPHRLFSAVQLRRRFPAVTPLDGTVGLLEERAGVLDPEGAITAFLEIATRHHATLHVNERVLGWDASGAGVAVRTAERRVTAERLIVAAGAWIQALVPDLGIPFEVTRQPLYWFEPDGDPALFAPDRCPVALCEYAPGRIVYWMPDFGDGVKVAIHHEGERTDPDAVRRSVSPEEDARVVDVVRRFLPRARRIRDRAVCLYTNTPDQHFVIDWHPAHERVLVLSPCSGHGFKFAPVVGEIAADLVMGRTPPYDLTPFSIGRERPQAAAGPT